MPVRDCARYVEAAIESILGQTFPDFEFIILDDGSADDTPWILDRFRRNDRRIRVIEDGARRGVAARLNQGLALARAPLIARMDADDVSLPRRFSIQMAHLERNPGLVLLGTRAIIIDPDGEVLCEMGSALSHDDIDAGLMSRAGQLVYHPSVAYRKDVALAAGGYDESYGGVEDLDFFLRMAERGRIENLAEPLIRYREHFRKVGFRRAAEQEREIGRAIAAARRRRGLPEEDAAEAGVSGLVLSRPETLRKWAWWALASGQKRVARKHARKAFLREPLSLRSMKTLYYAVRGF